MVRFESDETKAINAQPFLMPIEEVVIQRGGRIVALGKVQRGILHQGDTVEIVSAFHKIPATAKLFLVFGHIDYIETGDLIGIVLSDVNQTAVASGMVLAAPDSIQAHQRFSAIDLPQEKIESTDFLHSLYEISCPAKIQREPERFIIETEKAINLDTDISFILKQMNNQTGVVNELLD